MSGTSELIDLSQVSDREQDFGRATGMNQGVFGEAYNQDRDLGTPDVEFVSSRPAGQPANNRSRLASRVPSGTSSFLPQIPSFAHLRDQIARASSFRPFPAAGANITGPTGVDRASADADRARILHMEQMAHGGPNQPLNLALLLDRGLPRPGRATNDTDFTNLAFDYGQPAFAFAAASSNDERSSTPPRASSPYKAPVSAIDGFTRKAEEEEKVICPHCMDELGIGEEDVKVQVWVAKPCGHVCRFLLSDVPSAWLTLVYQVYCGECATSRTISKTTARKHKQAGVTRKSHPLKTCVAGKCGKVLTSKTAMVQVYL